MSQELIFKVGDKVVYDDIKEMVGIIRQNRGSQVANMFNNVVYGIVRRIGMYRGNQTLIIDWVNHKGIVVIPDWKPSTDRIVMYKP